MTTDNPSRPGTGPAGRRLLSALDRATNVDTDLVNLHRTDVGSWAVEGRGKGYATATVRTLLDTGLVEELTEATDVTIAPVRTLRLTAQGAAFLGA